MKLVESILTKNPCYTAGRKITVKGLMLHSVGCNQPKASVFINNWNSVSYSNACVHGFIDALDGTVYQTLPWNHRGWHCASGNNGSGNNTHIGVEMCEPACIKYTGGSSFTCTDLATAQACVKRTYEAAVELFAMLCKKFGLNPLADGVIISHKEGHARGIASNHGDPEHLWTQLKMGYTMDTFRKAVKANMDGGSASTQQPSAQVTTPVSDASDEKKIWDFLFGKIGNAYGVAGMMGNLYAESGLKPTNLQNTYEKSLGMTDAEYTAAVDNGSYGNFVYDKAGYGLVQWTYYSRKQNLLDFAKGAGKSIGDLGMQLDFLWKELQGYTTVLNTLKNAKTVLEASNIVLFKFEAPADQSETVQSKRASYGQGYFDKYAGKTVTTQPSAPAEEFPEKLTSGYYRVRKSWADAASQKGAYQVLAYAKNCADQNPGYSVYLDGKCVYPVAANAAFPYKVRVSIDDLNIRRGPGTNHEKTGKYTGKGIFTIVEESNGAGSDKGWGLLKAYADERDGWIALDYCQKI